MAVQPTVLPPQGTPGIFDPRNPTLVPNFNRSVANGVTVDHQSPRGAVDAEARADAQATATIGGTVTTGDEITLEVFNGTFPNGYISHTYTTVAGDTVTTIAENLADLFDLDPAADRVNLTATAVGAVVTINQNGPIGNLSTLTSPLSAPSKITVGGTALTGDQIAVLFSGPALGPVTTAQALGTVAGLVVLGDTIALTFTNTSIAAFPITVTYTALAGDTDASVAAGLVALIEGQATLKANSLEASAVGAEITFQQPGAIGNTTTISYSASGAETVTFDPSSGTMAGGAGQPGGVLVQSNTTTSQNATTMGGNLATAINADATLSGLSVTGTNSGGVVSLAVPAAVEPLTVSSWVNTITPTATITGSVAAADVLTLTFNAAYLPGATHSVSHTALLAETTTTLATNLAAAINADSVLIAAGIGATSSTNVITFTYQANAGQIRFAETVSPGSETITLTTAPTETAVVATKASETIVIGTGATAVVAASATALLGGTETNGDTVTLVFTNAAITGSPVSISVTAATSLNATAALLNTAINANAALAAANVTSTVSSATLTIQQLGAVGNALTLSYTQGGNSETITFTPSNGILTGGAGVLGNALSGGTGPVFATNNFEFAPSTGGLAAYFYGQPYDLGFDLLGQMVAQGMPIT
jgi:hypothetical protein